MQGAQKATQLDRVDHCGMVPFWGRDQGAAQVCDGVPLGPVGRHGIAHDLATVLHDAVRGLERLALLHLPGDL
ncbi:hypothetical protein G6F63_016941 [Rhizopus arrhizus]|nr:hypothetical protein G6F68_014331 [Rhizopus microsporus]KAG1292673.1 hypothetical protein G6F63_016941 [Rhizopus arrhizus]KAG1360514.1 hypothetical protein G6F60_015794 [Rhizopus arrhizus]KAG1433754.1 hypothetical protein G6F56_014522 [Rhizopus delemar]